MQGRQLENKRSTRRGWCLLRLPDGCELTPDHRGAGRGRVDPSRLQRAKAETARAIEAFEFHRAALGLYEFVYGELCDWYWRSSSRACTRRKTRTSRAFALGVLAEDAWRSPNPVIPFVTEELWSHAPGADGLLMAHAWPTADESLTDAQAERSWRARSRRCKRCAAGATGSAARARGAAAGAARGRGLRAHGGVRRPDGALRVVAGRRRAGRDGGVPGGSVALLATTRSTSERRRAGSSSAALAGSRAHARRAAAGERRLHRQGAGAVVQAERVKLAGCARSATRCDSPTRFAGGQGAEGHRLERGASEEYLSGSSCSACASGSSGCAAC